MIVWRQWKLNKIPERNLFRGFNILESQKCWDSRRTRYKINYFKMHSLFQSVIHSFPCACSHACFLCDTAVMRGVISSSPTSSFTSDAGRKRDQVSEGTNSCRPDCSNRKYVCWLSFFLCSRSPSRHVSSSVSALLSHLANDHRSGENACNKDGQRLPARSAKDAILERKKKQPGINFNSRRWLTSARSLPSRLALLSRQSHNPEGNLWSRWI